MVHRRLLLWFAWLAIALLALLTQPRWEGMLTGVQSTSVLDTATVLAVCICALLCEYLDTCLGMGFGTVMAPLLLAFGFEPLEIVPAVLFSELSTGLLAGLLHQRDGNIDLIRDRRALRILILLVAFSAIGATAAVLLAVRIDARWLAYGTVAVMLAMGAATLVAGRRPIPYRGGSILAIGLVAAFSKGVSGGGYGALVTSGQVLSGVPARQAVAITSVAEATACLVVLMGYLATKGAPEWDLAIPLATGALLAVPLATLTVRRLSDDWLKTGVGILTLALGLWSLAELAL